MAPAARPCCSRLFDTLHNSCLHCLRELLSLISWSTGTAMPFSIGCETKTTRSLLASAATEQSRTPAYLVVLKCMGATRSLEVFRFRCCWALIVSLADKASFATLAARFTRDRHFSSNGIKWKFFEPSRIDNATSVFVVDDLKETEIWSLGDTYAALDGRSPIARADIAPTSIEEVGLRFEIDNSPPRHAAITGWPTDKELVRLRAMDIARKAKLVVR